MSTTDYMGMFVYKDYHIDYIQTSEGRLKWNDHDSLFYAEYFIKDHLGNVRDVITTDPNFSDSLVQVTDYYPFGLEFQDVNASDNLQLYNSKELQREAKLDWYDYGARFYDPVLGRWHSVDPMAETSRRWSPYTYCMNNPIRFIDPDGMAVDDYYGRNGKFLGHQGSGTDQRYIREEKYSAIVRSGGGEAELNATGVSSVIKFQNNQNDVIDEIKSETDKPGAGEHGALIIFNTEDESNPTVEFGPIAEGAGDNSITMEMGNMDEDYHGIPKDTKVADQNSPFKVVIGQIHAHHDNDVPGVSTRSNNEGGNDMTVARDINGPCFAIGKEGQVISKVDQNRQISNEIPRANFDVLRDALKTHGGN